MFEIIKIYPKMDNIPNKIELINKMLIKCIGNPKKIDRKKAFIIKENINNVLNYWIGNTYVGDPKEKNLEETFQNFYSLLYKMLIFNEQDKIFIFLPKNALYEGKLYRFLGHSTPEYKNEVVEPNFNNIWVSWSKEDSRELWNYIRQKLYGIITKLECQTNTTKGIDLKAFGVPISNQYEKEIVFPTIKETIVNISFIDEEEG